MRPQLWFFQMFVLPSWQEHLAHKRDIRKAFHLAIDLHHMADYEAVERAADGSDPDVNEVRRELSPGCPAMQLIGDIADAAKHGRLRPEITDFVTGSGRRAREFKAREQLRSTPGLFQAPFGQGTFAEGIRLYADLDGERKSFTPLAFEVLSMWATRLGVPVERPVF